MKIITKTPKRAALSLATSLGKLERPLGSAERQLLERAYEEERTRRHAWFQARWAEARAEAAQP